MSFLMPESIEKKLRQKFDKYQASFIDMDFIFKISAREPRRVVDVTTLWWKSLLIVQLTVFVFLEAPSWSTKARIEEDGMTLHCCSPDLSEGGWWRQRGAENEWKYRISPQDSQREGTNPGKNHLTQGSQSKWRNLTREAKRVVQISVRVKM